MFWKVPEKSTISFELLEIANNQEGWIVYFNFLVKSVPLEVVFRDPFLGKLADSYSFQAGITMLEPNSCYTWHRDTRRGVGINMLLTPSIRSCCVFSNKVSDPLFPIVELKYQVDTYYVFNTQVDHMVVNFEQPRYMFSLEFDKQKEELSYTKLLELIKPTDTQLSLGFEQS